MLSNNRGGYGFPSRLKAGVSAEIQMNEFLHHLRDTLILLGGRIDIADRLAVIDLIDESDVDALRQYNIDLLETIKGRLVNVNKVEVQVTHDE